MGNEVLLAIISAIASIVTVIGGFYLKRYYDRRDQHRKTANGTTTGDMEAQNQTSPQPSLGDASQNPNSLPDGGSQNIETSNYSSNMNNLTNIKNCNNTTNNTAIIDNSNTTTNNTTIIDNSNTTKNIYSAKEPTKKTSVEDFKKKLQEFDAKINSVLQICMEEDRKYQNEPTEELKLWIKNSKEIKKKGDDLLEKNFEENEGSSQNIAFKKMVDEIETHIQKHKNFQPPLFVPKPPPNVVQQPIHYVPVSSIETKKKEVYDALNQVATQVIGLWGMGGIGKTTLMKQINNEMAKGSDFKLVVMVTVSSDLNINSIQDEIFHRLKLTLGGDSSIDTCAKANRLSEYLKKNGSALIIFDDVWETSELNLKDIGIPVGNGEGESKCCSVVITTRDQNVCRRMSAKEIKMSELNATESWVLFKKNAGINEHVDPEIEKLANKVCKECSGLPLAITVLAKALYRETADTKWRETLKYLRENDPQQGVSKNLEKTVYKPLKRSYDLLPTDDLKKGFLLCSLFPEDHIITIDELICYGIAGIREGRIAAGCQGLVSSDAYCNIFIELKRKGLLQDVTEEEDDAQIHSARMHDVVRDVAISIAKDAFKGYFDTKHISLLKDSRELPENFKEVKILSLNDNYKLSGINSPDFLNEMENELLLNLILREKSSSPIVDICIQKLKNLRALLIKIEVIKSANFNSVNIEDLLLLRGLSVLCLQGVYISELTEEFSERLVHLRVIDFSHTKIDIIRPKTFSRLENVLEVLNMQYSFSKWQAYSNEEDGIDNIAFAELGNLKQLYSLHLNIDDERIFSHEYSPNLVFPLVQSFSIRSAATMLYWHSCWYSNELCLPEIQINNVAYWLQALYGKTKNLWLSGNDRRQCCIFDAMLEGYTLKLMSNLKSLFLRSVLEQYKHVIQSSSTTEGDQNHDEASSSILPKLTRMHIFHGEIENLFAITTIPNGSFGGLKTISINLCSRLKFIFPWNMVVCLVQLENLDIWECSSLEVIIEKHDCDFDQSVFGSKAEVFFPKLRSMTLRGLPILKSLWEQEMELPSLMELDVTKCMKLNSLFLGEKNAPMLQSLKCEKELFDQLYWEDDQAASRIKSIVKFVR